MALPFKHLPKLLVLLFAFLVVNCEQEGFVEQVAEFTTEQKTNLPEVTRINVKDIPSLSKFFQTKMPNYKSRTNASGNYIEMPFGNIPLEDVMQVIDTLGNTNHTFRIIPNIWKPNNFYNLIVYNNPDLSEPISYVMHYEVDQTYSQNLSQGTVGYDGFTGNIKKYTLEAFLDQNKSMRGADFNCDPPEAAICLEIVLNDGSTNDPNYNDTTDGTNNTTTTGNGSGSGNSNTNTNTNTGGTTTVTCSQELVTKECSYNGGHFGDYAECNAPFMGSMLLVTTCSDGFVEVTDLNDKSQTRNGNCDDSSGAIAVDFTDFPTYLNLSVAQILWLNENCNKATDIYAFLGENDFSQEAQNFVDYAIQVLMINPDANPFLRADCSSFEYAQPPGTLQKGCAVTDFNHTFYALGINSQGNPYYGDIESNVSIIYFTMPTGMTNGQAANLTAKAVTFAANATDVYFFTNPYDSEYEVIDFFRDTLTARLAIVGGSFSTTYEPFPIPSPAPYITSVVGISDAYDCD